MTHAPIERQVRLNEVNNTSTTDGKVLAVILIFFEYDERDKSIASRYINASRNT